MMKREGEKLELCRIGLLIVLGLTLIKFVQIASDREPYSRGQEYAGIGRDS